MRPDRKTRLSAGAGSVLGFAVAVAIAASLPSKPAVGQVPGFAAEHGFDPHTDVLRLGILAVFPLAGGAAGTLLASRRCGHGAALPGRGTARNAGGGLTWPAGTGLRLSAIAAHAISVWTFLVVPLTERGVPPILSLAALAAVSFALSAVSGRTDPRQGAEFLAAACPILPFALLGPRPSTHWLAVGVAGLVLPLLARAAAAFWPGARRPLRILLLWVLLPGSVTGLVGAAILRAPTVGDVFEDGHSLLPASEYLRGERPYRDIVPGHGLLSDGLLQTAQLELFGDDYRGLKRGTKILGAFFLPAAYALGWAASGSPAVGFGGLLLTLLILPNYLFVRALLSIWTLVLAISASRTKKPGAWVWVVCGAALPIGLCVAVDFTAYAAAGVAVALSVARGNRLAHLRRVLIGAGVSAGAIALALLAYGILDDFTQTTFVFVPSLLPVYALGFPPLEASKDDLAPYAWLRNQTALGYVFLAISAVVSGALLPRAPRVGVRARGLLPVLAWIGCGMLSVIERHHVTYSLLVAPVCLLLLHRWARGGKPWTSVGALASALLLAVVILGRRPVAFVSAAAGAITRPWTPPGARAVEDEKLPRARGAVFPAPDAALIDATSEMIRRADLRDGETWLDFANAPGLYYLFDRDCPIRYYEVPFYESEEAQREVIAAVAANPRVRVVLVSSGLLAQEIDHISNGERVPRVAAFLRERFRPFWSDGPVEFWIRKDDPLVSSGSGSERP